MSYIRKQKRSRGALGALGDLASTITNLASAAGVATDIATDPYLPETICRVGQLKAINHDQKPGACVKSRDGMPGGVGLRKLIKPMRGYVYAEQYPIAYVGAAALVFGLPLLIGYSLGKGR